MYKINSYTDFSPSRNNFLQSRHLNYFFHRRIQQGAWKDYLLYRLLDNGENPLWLHWFSHQNLSYNTIHSSACHLVHSVPSHLMKSPSYKLWRFPLKYPRETHEILAMLVPTAVTTVAQMQLEVNQLCLPDHWEAFKNSPSDARK